MPDYYNLDGEPITLWEWASLFESRDYRMVGHTMVGSLRVSTIWMGLNHNYFGKGPPIIFETMVFDEADNGAIKYQERYSTLKEAERGQKDAVIWAEVYLAAHKTDS